MGEDTGGCEIWARCCRALLTPPAAGCGAGGGGALHKGAPSLGLGRSGAAPYTQTPTKGGPAPPSEHRAPTYPTHLQSRQVLQWVFNTQTSFHTAPVPALGVFARDQVLPRVIAARGCALNELFYRQQAPASSRGARAAQQSHPTAAGTHRGEFVQDSMFAATRSDEIIWAYRGKGTSSGLLKEEGDLAAGTQRLFL